MAIFQQKLPNDGVESKGVWKNREFRPISINQSLIQFICLFQSTRIHRKKQKRNKEEKCLGLSRKLYSSVEYGVVDKEL